MIVDVHTHTPSHTGIVPPNARRAFAKWRNDRTVVVTTTWDDFAAAAAPVDVSIVFNIAADDPLGGVGAPPADAKWINDSTAEFVAADPQRRIGFLSVNPTVPGARDEVERAQELGLVGIKLGPNYQRFDPLALEAAWLLQHAERAGLPILFHQGASPVRDAPLRYAHPLLIDEVAIRYPELRIVMAHMGHPWVRDTITVIRKHPHVYADVSAVVLRPWMCYEALVFATEWNATNKLLFGSDYPIVFAQEGIDRLRGVNAVTEGTGLPRVPADAVESIIHADALTALGLQLPEMR